MLESRWMVLAGAGFLLFLFWVFIFDDHRVYVSAGLSGVLFGVCTLTAPGVEALAQDGTMVAAPIDESVQFIAVLALLSLTVVYLRRLGKWPPEKDPEAQP